MSKTVAICIPTFRRPDGLRRALIALIGLAGDFDFRVVVADNDPEGGAGLSACRKLVAEGYPFPLVAVPVRERGIAQARNALVAAALAGEADFIAMIDDDAWPAPDWLETLVRLLDSTAADLAGTGIDHAYEQPPSPEVAAFNDGFRRRQADEGIAPILYNTCGVVVRRTVFEAMARPWFQPDYGLAGGEDDDFFLRAKAEGWRFAFSPRKLVTEFVPASRATHRFLSRRAYAQGATWTHIRRRRRPAGWSRGAEVAKVVAGLATGAATYAFMFWSPRHRLQAECRIMRAAGKINGLRGNLVEVYRVTHGQ